MALIGGGADGAAHVGNNATETNDIEVEGDSENSNTTPMWRRSYATPKQAAVDQQK